MKKVLIIIILFVAFVFLNGALVVPLGKDIITWYGLQWAIAYFQISGYVMVATLDWLWPR